MAVQKRVIFLDIDGVLNYMGWRHPPGVSWPLCDVDPVLVDRLNALVRKTKVRIVLSSSWRIATSERRSRARLKEIGVRTGLLIGITPRLPSPLTRGTEIEAWLIGQEARHGERPRFVILDDDDDMEPHQDRLVRTDPHVGLTEADCERVAALLGEG